MQVLRADALLRLAKRGRAWGVSLQRGEEAVEVREQPVLAVDQDSDGAVLADNFATRDEAEETRVVAVVAVVTEHEGVPFRPPVSRGLSGAGGATGIVLLEVYDVP